jgi:branched-chain amino acid aminotransferase
MICYNGNYIDNFSINSDNRGFKYGDCFFETIKCYNGLPLFWESHYFRMASSFGMLKMIPPNEFDIEYFESLIKALLIKNNLDTCSARIRISFYRVGLGYYNPLENGVDYIIESEYLSNHHYKMINEGLSMGIYKDNLIAATPLSSIKTNSRLINILSSIYAQENSINDCLLLNNNKMVTESISGNIFIVNKTQIFTPPLSDGCINGVLRTELINMNKFNIKERSLSVVDILNADEIFITNVIQGLQWVSNINHKNYTNKMISKIINFINRKYLI